MQNVHKGNANTDFRIFAESQKYYDVLISSYYILRC